MSVNQKKCECKLDGDTFLEFLGDYHEAKWEENDWYDVDGCITINHLSRKVDVKNLEYPDNWNKDKMIKFCKYLDYQLQQWYQRYGKVRYAYDLYVKVYHKKTRNISTQTEVSLSPNKKYFTNKC